MRTIMMVMLACLIVTGCGPAEEPEPGRGKQFMEGLGKDCPKCGKTKINLFGGEK
jgi:predicted small secreted protein